MEGNAVVFDISSDEEPALDVAAGGNDFRWLTKLLCVDVDSSDDVVLVGEIKSKSSKVTAGNNEYDDDDDCVILDGDPDKPVAVADDKADGGDDLIIVSQKGQIACRDYPHPRHLCAKFIFSSTPHETHCDRCHCYVCDIPAPCARWGTGDSCIDHCHATEKQELWTSQRKIFRREKDASLTLQVPNTSLSLPLPQLNHTPARDIIQVPQNQVSRPAIIRGCSPKLTIPKMISQFRSRRSGPVFSRHRFPARSDQQSQMLRVCNNGMRNPKMVRKPGVIATGGSEVTQFVHGLSNIKIAYGSQCSQNAAPRATSNDRIDVPCVHSMNHDSFTYQSTSQSGMENGFMSTVPSQPHVYSQPLPQPEVYSHPMAQQLVHSQPIPKPKLYTQHSPLSNEGEDINELGNQMQNSTGLDISEFGEWLGKTNRSNRQPQVENCQLPRTGCINAPLPAEDFNSLCDGTAKLTNNYSVFENWHQESHFLQMSEGYVPSDPAAVTSDPAAFNAGMLLFDFETSFNGLTPA